MTDSEAIVSIINGPYAGNYQAKEMSAYMSKGAIRIPVDESFSLTSAKPFALALHDDMNIPGDVRLYSFRKFLKMDESPFVVEFVGGPLEGKRPLFQPAIGLPPTINIPVTAKPAKNADGRVRAFAVYRRDSSEIGKSKLVFVNLHSDIVKDTRVIFEMVGGPYDGVTYDTDAKMVDYHSAFSAEGNYLVTSQGQIGKRFAQQSPHCWSSIEEFGEQAIKHGGPYLPHIYEVFERLEEPFEVYVRAKYVGLLKGE